MNHVVKELDAAVLPLLIRCQPQGKERIVKARKPLRRQRILAFARCFQRIQTRRKLHKAHIQLLHAPPDLFRMARDGICERAEDVKLHAGFLQHPHAFQHAPVRAAA